MKVLIVGSGGREHAIAWSVSQSKKVDKIYCAPGNGGISQIAECVDIAAMEFDKLADFAEKNEIDLTIIGMDDPLVGGIVDVFEERGLRVFGPRKNAAIIEGSKSFSKDLISEIIYFLHKYGIQITAEGIENQLQAKELSDMGCDFLQGYLISKPVSFKDFCAFIDAHNKKGSAEMKETPEEKGKNEPQKRKMKKSNIPYDFPVLAE